ncbi:conserved hypothetical protein [Candida dubliniensis CD36]|uniref:protein-histidine N-methyltransferase n=1 Tax=Candida dubliniensis (strain CD36 / ATCC MYA-646 / CBS 7987 / NCPF 3949 / NRRL Y-17841) TaxID=573826 RepID=B9W8S8_CANDC|nr:conserved hypothetical protein [Candida dubliniensis CD36]CAX45150.1 conserved hypothetical protein [Candida dubliniensis CD36]
MSFSFGFTKDDFSDDDELEESNTYIKPNHSSSSSTTTTTAVSNPKSALDSLIISSENKPKLHNLDSILSTLQGIRISFDNYKTSQGNIIYRRELFDVKHQLMTEEEETTENSLINNLLIDENSNNNDLQKNVYEGGFKSWECSYDTVDALNKLIEQNGLFSSSPKNKSILELGCGTALPSCFILLKKLQSIKENHEQPGLTLVLSDFNYDVLRLVTVPNLLIHWASTLSIEQLYELTTTSTISGDKIDSRFVNDEILITSKLIEQFKNDLNNYNIQLKFISGSWGNEFIDLITKKNDMDIDIDVIISSETIYSPDTLPIVAESIKTIFQQTNNKKLAIIAAKNIYFGVGGSLIEFLNYFNQIIKNNMNDQDFTVSVEEINDSQLKRSLVYIDYKRDYCI